MSFLQKIGLKKKGDGSADVPPPPPKPKKHEAPSQDSQQPPRLPSLDDQQKSSAQDTQIRDLPSREQSPSDNQPNPAPNKQVDSTPKKQPDPAPKKKADPAPAPEQPMQRTGKPAQPQPPQLAQVPPAVSEKKPSPIPSNDNMQSKQNPEPSHQEVRDAFNDIPPIKGSDNPAPDQAQTQQSSDDAGQEFDVDNLKLPEGDAEPQVENTPEGAPTKSPVTQESESPFNAHPEPQQVDMVGDTQPELYIDIDTYEDIQRRIKDLKEQIGDAGKHIQGILSEREQEDKEFGSFIKELEQIQEDLITIDEDLFEEK